MLRRSDKGETSWESLVTERVSYSLSSRCSSECRPAAAVMTMTMIPVRTVRGVPPREQEGSRHPPADCRARAAHPDRGKLAGLVRPATRDGPAEETQDGPVEETRDGPAEETQDGPAEETQDGPAEETRDGSVEETRDGSAEETRDGPAMGTRVGAAAEAAAALVAVAVRRAPMAAPLSELRIEQRAASSARCVNPG